MYSQRGNLLLQVLLALALVFAFVPFVATRIASRDDDARMYTATRQVETAQTAARIFIRENAGDLPYEQTVVSGNAFSDLLEPYGLPLGFVARTALGQDIKLVINKNYTDVSAFLELSGGNLSGLQAAELARRIGFYAVADGGVVRIGVPLENLYSDVVRRNTSSVDDSEFLTDLNMGDFSVENIGRTFAARGDFETAQFSTLSIVGTESGRKVRNQIDNMTATKTVFQSRSGASALSLTRGVLSVGNLSGKTIAKFGDTGNFTADAASVYDFSMTAGRTGFSGPLTWNIRGNVVSDNINFSVERLDVNSFINASRGQDVYVTDELEYSARSGMETDTLIASNITMRDQTSDSISAGGTGAAIIDVRPAGTSLLPDVLVDSINNGAFSIISNPRANDAKTVDCRSIITSLDGVYNQKSLSQYIICQYVYWQRLEQRINIKQCLMAGNSGCI